MLLHISLYLEVWATNGTVNAGYGKEEERMPFRTVADTALVAS